APKKWGGGVGGRKDASHNLIAGALHDVPCDLDPLRAAETGRPVYLFFAIGFVPRQKTLGLRSHRPEITLAQLAEWATSRRRMRRDGIGFPALVGGRVNMPTSSAVFEHSKRGSSH